MKVVKTLQAIQTISVGGKPQERRIAILQRDDGYFAFAEEYSYKSEFEGEIIAEGWAQPRNEADVSQEGHNPICISALTRSTCQH